MSVRWRSVGAVVGEASLAWSLAGLAAWLWHPLWTPLCMVAIATRQHALFILYHDAVHGLFARSIRLNDLIINAFVGVPQSLPVHLYRALHLTHHRDLGSEGDPERVLLYAGQDWSYHPLPLGRLTRQLLGDLLLVNNLLTLGLYLRERLAPTGRLVLPRTRPHAELFVMNAVFWGLAAFALWHAPAFTLRLAVVWFVPLLTLTQAIQKVRSFAEHAALDAPELSYSWRPGLLGRLILWPYNIQYHREHHIHPNVPWFELPARFPERSARPGHTLPALLWNGRLR